MSLQVLQALHASRSASKNHMQLLPCISCITMYAGYPARLTMKPSFVQKTWPNLQQAVVHAKCHSQQPDEHRRRLAAPRKQRVCEAAPGVVHQKHPCSNSAQSWHVPAASKHDAADVSPVHDIHMLHCRALQRWLASPSGLDNVHRAIWEVSQ